jgi:hypothetical protein
MKYLRGADEIGLGITIKYLQCSASGAAGNGIASTIKYLQKTTSGAAGDS